MDKRDFRRGRDASAVFAFLATDADGNERIIRVTAPDSRRRLTEIDARRDVIADCLARGISVRRLKRIDPEIRKRDDV